MPSLISTWSIRPRSVYSAPHQPRLPLHYEYVEQWSGQKSGGDGAIRPECVRAGMIFPPRWVQRARLPNYLAPSCVAWALRPARHREDVWLLALRHAHSLRAPQMARRPRGVARQSAGGGGAGRTVEPPGALWAGAAAHRALAPPGLQGEAWRALPCRRRRAPHDAPRFGWAVPVQEPHTPHAALPRFMPPTALSPCRGAASARGPRAANRRQAGPWTCPASCRRAPRRFGGGPGERPAPAAALRRGGRACRARPMPAARDCFCA